MCDINIISFHHLRTKKLNRKFCQQQERKAFIKMRNNDDESARLKGRRNALMEQKTGKKVNVSPFCESSWLHMNSL